MNTLYVMRTLFAKGLCLVLLNDLHAKLIVAIVAQATVYKAKYLLKVNKGIYKNRK